MTCIHINGLIVLE